MESVEYVINAQNKASGALNAAADSMRRLSASTKGAATAMKTLAAVQIGSMLAKGFTSAANFVSGYARELANAKDAINDVAQRTGFAAEALQSMGWAAHLAGVENFNAAIQKFTVVMGKAVQDGKGDAFAQIGLSLEKVMLLSPEEQFRTVSEAIGKIPTEAGRAAAAVELFGKAGAQLVPLFTSNLAEAEAQAQRLGMVLSTNQVGAIAEMNDALDATQQTFDGIISQVTANLAPVVTGIANEFLGFVEGFQGITGDSGGNALADAITNAFFDVAETLAVMFDDVLAGFSDVGAWMTSFVNGFQSAINVFAIIVESLKIGFNLFSLAGSGITLAIGTLLEGLGWFSESVGNFGKELKGAAQEQIESTAASMNESVQRIGAAASGTLFSPENRPGGGGAVSEAVRGARERFGEIRTVDPAKEAEKQRERELSLMQAQREAAQKKAAEEFAGVIKEAADSQKELNGLIKERDQITSEQSKKMMAPTPANQAVVDRFVSRGPAMEANERTAAATEKLTALNEEIRKKQEKIEKAAEATAKNTAVMFGIIGLPR